VLNGFGLSYRSPQNYFEGFYLYGGKDNNTNEGGTLSGDLNMSVLRFNWSYFGKKDWKFIYSFIQRTANLATRDNTNTPVFTMNTDSMTNGLMVKYLYRKRITLGGMASLEQMDIDHGEPVAITNTSNSYIKSGVYGSLSF